MTARLCQRISREISREISRSLYADEVGPRLKLIEPRADSTGKINLGLWQDAADTDILLRDYAGVLRAIPGVDNVAVPGGVVPIKLARNVHNIADFSEDFSDAVWLALGGASVTGTNNINFPSVSGQLLQNTMWSGSDGQQFVLRIELSGSGTTHIGIVNADLSSIATRAITLSATPVIYSVAVTLSGATADQQMYLRLQRESGDTATLVVANKAQLQDKTGDTNAAIPDEYQKTDSGVSLYGWAYYVNGNNNTVNGAGVVTEAVGAVLSPTPRMAHRPARTNKCTNYNLSPTDITNVTKGGDAASTLTVVTPGSYPPALVVVGNGDVFKLDNSAGSAEATATFGGTTGNTNAHSALIYVMCDGGANELRLASTKIADITSTSWVELTAENKTPGATTDQLVVQATAGQIVYFIANDLQEGIVVSPLIEIAGSAQPRDITIIRHPRAGYFNQNSFTVLVDHEWAVPQTEIGVVGHGLIGVQASILSIMMAKDSGFLSVDSAFNIASVNPSFIANNKWRCVVSGEVGGDFRISEYDIDGSGPWGHGTPVSHTAEYTEDTFIILCHANDYPVDIHKVEIRDQVMSTEDIEAISLAEYYPPLEMLDGTDLEMLDGTDLETIGTL